ncbi:MAG: hypothetical protein KF777_24265, partial [Planctomycetaceae bacterium]|nr:hypothetical protein [Planctomycetaceae bacterium]
LRRSAGGRCRLPAARDVAPHHTPGGGSTAERGDSLVRRTDVRHRAPRAIARRISQSLAVS